MKRVYIYLLCDVVKVDPQFCKGVEEKKKRINELRLLFKVPIKRLLGGIPGNPINLKELCIVKAYKFREIGNKWSIRLGHTNLITAFY